MGNIQTIFTCVEYMEPNRMKNSLDRLQYYSKVQKEVLQKWTSIVKEKFRQVRFQCHIYYIIILMNICYVITPLNLFLLVYFLLPYRILSAVQIIHVPSTYTIWTGKMIASAFYLHTWRTIKSVIEREILCIYIQTQSIL